MDDETGVKTHRSNRAARRKAGAQVRHKADTPHGLGKRQPRDWQLARKRRRKAQKLARRR